jgi:hypothetical protein
MFTDGCGLIYMYLPYAGMDRRSKGKIYKEDNYYRQCRFSDKKPKTAQDSYAVLKDLFKNFYKYSSAAGY